MGTILIAELQGGVSTQMKSISLYFYSGIDDSPTLYFWPICLDPFIDHFMCFFFARVVLERRNDWPIDVRCIFEYSLSYVPFFGRRQLILGEAFIRYSAGMTGKTHGQCRHCRQNQT